MTPLSTVATFSGGESASSSSQTEEISDDCQARDNPQQSHKSVVSVSALSRALSPIPPPVLLPRRRVAHSDVREEDQSQEKLKAKGPSSPFPAIILGMGSIQSGAVRISRSEHSRAERCAFSFPLRPSSAPCVQGFSEAADGTEKSRIIAEVALFGEHLAKSPFHDVITEALRRWQERFSWALRLCDSQAGLNAKSIRNAFAEHLKRLLIDPVFGTPLDSKAVLGSDGIAYNSRSLGVFLSLAPTPYCHRSPLDPSNQEAFTVIPHSIVWEAIMCFQEQGPSPSDDETGELYTMLMRVHGLVLLPIEQNERSHHPLATQIWRNGTSGSCPPLSQQSSDKSEKTEPIHARAQIVADAYSRALGHVQEQEQKSIVKTRNWMEMLRVEAQMIREENHVLRRQIKQEGSFHSLGEKNEATLRLLLNESEIEIRRREKSQLGNLLWTVELIGSSAVKSWLMHKVPHGKETFDKEFFERLEKTVSEEIVRLYPV